MAQITCNICGSPEVIAYWSKGHRYHRRFCSKHWSQHTYSYQKRRQLAAALKRSSA